MILMIAMIDDDGFWICPLHCPGNLRELHSDTEVQGTLEHLLKVYVGTDTINLLSKLQTMTGISKKWSSFFHARGP